MEKTPKSLRLQIGIFGRTNVGKSSFLNLISGQDVSIISDLPGTTTDVVEKTMELLPVGPVVFLDTAGIDDASSLSTKRIDKTKKIFDRADIILLVIEPGILGEYELAVIAEAEKRKTPYLLVINKIDLKDSDNRFLEECCKFTKRIVMVSSIDHSKKDDVITLLKKYILEICPEDFLASPALISDLVSPGEVAILIVPIDLEAPKGRLILPQVQTIRDLLDNDSIAVTVKEKEYLQALNSLNRPPKVVVCDSQVVLKMVAETPKDINCTTFSILFSRYKGNLIESVKGALTIDDLNPQDKVLIAEACSHHPIADDIGRVKLPRWLKQYVGGDLNINIVSGRDYPSDINDYKLIIHCGGCMLTRRESCFRFNKALDKNIPITNYGVCISFLHGVLERVLSPFPYALQVFNDFKKERGKHE